MTLWLRREPWICKRCKSTKHFIERSRQGRSMKSLYPFGYAVAVGGFSSSCTHMNVVLLHKRGPFRKLCNSAALLHRHKGAQWFSSWIGSLAVQGSIYTLKLRVLLCDDLDTAPPALYCEFCFIAVRSRTNSSSKLCHILTHTSFVNVVQLLSKIQCQLSAVLRKSTCEPLSLPAEGATELAMLGSLQSASSSSACNSFRFPMQSSLWRVLPWACSAQDEGSRLPSPVSVAPWKASTIEVIGSPEILLVCGFLSSYWIAADWDRASCSIVVASISQELFDSASALYWEILTSVMFDGAARFASLEQLKDLEIFVPSLSPPMIDLIPTLSEPGREYWVCE